MENLIRNVQNMHIMKKLLIILLACCLVPFATQAQDARQRTATTIIADALAQLVIDPAGRVLLVAPHTPRSSALSIASQRPSM